MKFENINTRRHDEKVSNDRRSVRLPLSPDGGSALRAKCGIRSRSPIQLRCLDDGARWSSDVVEQKALRRWIVTVRRVGAKTSRTQPVTSRPQQTDYLPDLPSRRGHVA